MDKVRSINADLSAEFEHNKVDTSLGWGTEEGANNLIITFYEYKMDTKTYAELEQISNKVIDRILTRNPDLKMREYIEVRFTKEENTDKASSFVTFKIMKNSLQYKH